MNKHRTLQDRLAQSLDKANKREIKTCIETRTIASPPAADRKCTKLSISLFKTDMARLNGICSYMATRGHRLSTSQAVKLALRTATLSDDLVGALAAIRTEDGRAPGSPGRPRACGEEPGGGRD